MAEADLDDAAKNTLEYYKVLKDYAKHEDTLMNFRMTWCLGISSLMFTSVALLVNDLDKVPRLYLLGANMLAIYPIIFFIAILGLVVARLSFKGVRAAEISLGSLNEIWAENGVNLPFGHNLPRLLGGVRATAGSVEEQDKHNIATAAFGFFERGRELDSKGDHNYVARHYPTILISIIFWSWLIIGSLALALAILSLYGVTPLAK